MIKTLHYIILGLFLLASCNPPSHKTENGSGTNHTVYNGPIIDMHLHAYHPGNPMLGMTHPPTLRNKTYQGAPTSAELRDQVFEKFRKHNIVKAAITNGELWYEEGEGVVLIGNSNFSIEELRQQHEGSMLDLIIELAPFYSGRQLSDPSILPYFELAQELDIPIGTHIFPGGPNYGFHRMPQMMGATRIENAHPLQLEPILVQFPSIKLYIMHGGWPYVDDIKALLYAHPNVYVDIAVINWILPQEELNNYLKSLIDAGFEDRILFGTDQMVWPETIDDAVISVNAVDFLTIEQKEKIFFYNAAKFLELSDEEIEQLKGNQ